MWTCAAVLALVVCAGALTRDQFYPNGPGLDQNLPRGSEVPSPELVLRVPIRFYGETYESIFINNFGVLTFRADLPSFLNIEFPLPYPAIAAFYTNIDTTEIGEVFYRETNEPHILIKAEESVQDNFHEYFDFQPRSVVIATWVDVTYTSNSSSSNPRNSFQIAIISNGTESFVELLYPERDIQWFEKESQIQSLPDAKAQAGFISEDGRIYELRGSGSHQIRNIVSWTNTHLPGQYVFRIGDIPLNGNVAPPDQYNQNEVEMEEESKTCAQSGPSVCHIDATCMDYPAGICCKCKDGYYGNGKSCIKDDIPLRVHGKINGALNNKNLDDVDIQAYVVVGEGRAYTALSLVPPELGSSLQLLNVLGGVVGWLFAKPIGSAKNGYQLTGSLFNYTADISFPALGHRVTIKQEYLGHDVFDQITLDTDIRGSLPLIRPTEKIEIVEYEEQYSLIEPGHIRSQSTRTFKNKLTGELIEQTVSQTFTFSSCRFKPPSDLDKKPITLRVSKNYLGYELENNIVRYGMTNKIYPLDQEDPCNGNNNCGPHSSCVAQSNSYKCVCHNGFTNIYQDGGSVCVDIDECQAGTHNCDQNADCYNHGGGFQCSCRAGYFGNGVNCKLVSACHTIRCDENAQCIEHPDAAPECRCKPGFYGNGQYCIPTPETAEADYNDTFVLPNCDASRCTCPQGYTEYRDSSNNQLCRIIDTNTDQQVSYGNSYGQRVEPSYRPTDPPYQPTEPYYQPQTDRTYSQPTESTYPSPQPPYVGPWDINNQPEQDNDQQNNNNPSTENDNPSNNYDPNYNYNANSQLPPYPSENSYRQTSNNEYQQPLDNQYQQPDDTNYSQSSDRNYPLPPNYNYPQESQNNYDQQPSGNNYQRSLDNNNYQQTSETNYYEQTPSTNYQTQTSSEPSEDALIACNEDADCPPNAVCSYLSLNAQDKHCVCPEGYEGDAFECIERTTPSCNCGSRAHCVSVNARVNEYICVCDPGYHGDGYVCRPNFSCKNNSDCEYNAECLPDQQTSELICQCVKGYVKDENDACILDAQLCNGARCAEYATCLYDAELDLSYCHCNDGFTGDAISQCLPTEQSCDTANDCSPDAICTLIDGVRTYVCICKQGFTGDGYRCTIEATCLTDPNFCDLHASCLKRHDTYVCECNSGYNGNGSHCQLNPRPFGNFLVASDGASVYRVPFHVTARDFATPFNSGVSQIAVGIDVDCEVGNIYWGDVVSFAIKTSRYDGSGASIFLSDGVKSPEGIAIDWSARNIFWTDSKKLTIEVANLDTKARKVLFAVDNISNPRGIAVHPRRGKIFWSDWKRTNPKIEWANMDGSQRGVFLEKSKVALPNSLAIDWQRDRLCYADAGLFSIKCVTIDTLEEQTIASNCSYPFGLAIYGNKFYWTDWKTLKIEYVDIETQVRSQVPIATASRRLYGVAVAPEQCPQVHSVCMYRNGGCNAGQLCLPDGRNGRTCVDADYTYGGYRRRR